VQWGATAEAWLGKFYQLDKMVTPRGNRDQRSRLQRTNQRQDIFGKHPKDRHISGGNQATGSTPSDTSSLPPSTKASCRLGCERGCFSGKFDFVLSSEKPY